MTERRSRILVVDDERPNIQVLNSILHDDYDISVALNGEQALKRAFGDKKPDLILLDVQMPDMDGFEVCRRLQADPETQDIPVIFITAMSDQKDEEQGFAFGAVDYIAKPFGPAGVMARVKVHLELKRKRDLLRNLSTIDGLTAIANRRRLEDFFEFEWQRSVRSGESIAVIMADIDHFKLYNDHYGHAAGDECLREVAKTLASLVTRQTDLTARYGGEEFACVLPGTDLDGALNVAEEMRHAVQELGIPHAFSPTAGCITLSLGVASASPKANGSAPGELFRMADQALYAAKAGGRNRVVSAGALTNGEASGRTSPLLPDAMGISQADRKLVLVVDDEQININVLKAIFDTAYDTCSATTGRLTLERARQLPQPDIILLDIKMPDMDGYEVCRTLKADPRTRNIPILFISVLSTEADEALGLKAGAVDYIPKPFSPSVVLARVETHLKLRHTLESLSRRNKMLEEALSLRDSVERIMRKDLKRPLQRILAAADTLSTAPALPRTCLVQVEDIERSGFELMEMIASSIDLWKLERGVYHLHPHPVDLVKILHMVKRGLESLCTTADVNLVLLMDGQTISDQNCYFVQGEDLLCYSTLYNLVKNAIEASPAQGTVSVNLQHAQQAQRVRITNNGVIPLEIRSRFTEKGVTYGKKNARGLGVYTSRLMAEAMGAAMHLEYLDEDDATAVNLDFPGNGP